MSPKRGPLKSSLTHILNFAWIKKKTHSLIFDHLTQHLNKLIKDNTRSIAHHLSPLTLGHDSASLATPSPQPSPPSQSVPHETGKLQGDVRIIFQATTPGWGDPRQHGCLSQVAQQPCSPGSPGCIISPYSVQIFP